MERETIQCEEEKGKGMGREKGQRVERKGRIPGLGLGTRGRRKHSQNVTRLGIGNTGRLVSIRRTKHTILKKFKFIVKYIKN